MSTQKLNSQWSWLRVDSQGLDIISYTVIILFTKTLRSLIKGQLTSAQRRAPAIQGHIQTVQNKDIEKEGTQKIIYWHTDIDNIFFTRAPYSGNTES